MFKSKPVDLEKIPLDKLYFSTGTVRKKETYNQVAANFMPFNIDDIGDGEERWDKLKDIAVNYLKELKKLPSFAKEQDYERCGSWGYMSYYDLDKKAQIISSWKEEKREIKVFNNAFDSIVLPDGYANKIIEVVAQLKDSEKMFEEWGLENKIKRGKGD